MNEMPYVGSANQFMGGPPFGFNQPSEDMYMGPVLLFFSVACCSHNVMQTSINGLSVH